MATLKRRIMENDNPEKDKSQKTQNKLNKENNETRNKLKMGKT